MSAFAAEVFPDRALEDLIVVETNPKTDTALIKDRQSVATGEIKTGDLLGAEKKEVIKIGARSIQVKKDTTITVIRAEVVGFK
jgi:hypothetical protein